MEDFVKKELRNGLTSKPMYIPTWYRYDKEGSQLNDVCMEKSKWYYFHRFEMVLLKEIVKDVVSHHLSEHTVLVDLGSGNAVKTKLIIDLLLMNNVPLTYVPVDISEDGCSAKKKLTSQTRNPPDDIDIFGDLQDALCRDFYTNPDLMMIMQSVKSVCFLSTVSLFLDENESRPIHDVRKEFLQMISKNIRNEYRSKLIVNPIGGEYLDAVFRISKMYTQSRKLFVWFGSLQNLSYSDQVKYLTEISTRMQDEDRLLITMDITDSTKKQTIELAYLDPDCYAGMLHLNSIHRLNREMDADIDLTRFTIKNELHSVSSADSCSSVRVWIEADEDFDINIRNLDLTVGIKKGEKIFFHNGEGLSSKYTMAQIMHLCEKNCLGITNYWTNNHVACILLFRKS